MSDGDQAKRRQQSSEITERGLRVGIYEIIRSGGLSHAAQRLRQLLKKLRENTGDEGSSQFNRLEIWLACRDATSEQ